MNLSKRLLQKIIIILSITLILAIFILFKTKFQVEFLTKNLTAISIEISHKQQELEILEAEINYLTTPKRIENLSKKYLKNYNLD
jgi:hypothetical protein